MRAEQTIRGMNMMHDNTDNTTSALTPHSSREDLLHGLLEQASQPMLAVDSFGVVLLANQVARNLLGCVPGTLLKGAVPEVSAHIASILQYRLLHAEVQVHVGTLSFLVRMEPMLVEGEPVGAFCFFEDQTSPRELAEKMQAYHDLTRELNAIIDSSSEGLCICDAKGVVLRINQTSARFYNKSASAIVGRTVMELEEDGLIDRSATRQVIQSGQVCRLFQQRGVHRLMVTATPVYDSAGGLVRIVVSERDVTEIDNLRRELEEEHAIKDELWQQMLNLQEVAVKGRQMIAKSPNMVKAFAQALKVSGVNSSVFIMGESGVGKGVIAELIHKNSSRSEKPLIKLNCGSIPESLIESELFGYEKGAFTGAQRSKPGYFEMADGGILFLDEIAELPLSSQVKLLHFLEDGQIKRLGGTKSTAVDVRIIAATHRDLEGMVREGSFRVDLYYRLNVIPIQVPALRERPECIFPMINHYMDYFCESARLKKRISRDALEILLAYDYPGNVRELKNLCERLVVMSESDVIGVADLPGHLVNRPDLDKEGASDVWPSQMSLEQIMESVERGVLVRAWRRYENQARLAEGLGVNQSTITRKFRRYGIK